MIHRPRCEEEDAESCGVGLRITDSFQVRELVEGGPAFQSRRIKAGDILLAVDGAEIFNRPISLVRSMIAGQEGTVVRMRFRRSKMRRSQTKGVSELISDWNVYASLSAVPIPDCPAFAIPDLSISFDGSPDPDEGCFDVSLIRARMSKADSPSKWRRSFLSTSPTSPDSDQKNIRSEDPLHPQKNSCIGRRLYDARTQQILNIEKITRKAAEGSGGRSTLEDDFSAHRRCGFARRTLSARRSAGRSRDRVIE
jgi:hypothetical protein